MILPLVLLAAGAGIIGGLAASFWSPRVRTRSAVQHFAAGAVLAAVAWGVIPELDRVGTIPGIVGGFAAGGLLMIAFKWIVVRFERAGRGQKRVPVGLTSAAAVDTLLDGVVISAGFSSGQRLGTLLAIALALELFFLTLSVGAEFRRGTFPRWQGLAATSGIAALLLVGAAGAEFFLRGASEATVAVILAFGAAALIYLVAEELLVENVQAEESIFPTAMLFAGFLALVLLKLFS